MKEEERGKEQRGKKLLGTVQDSDWPSSTAVVTSDPHYVKS